MPRAAKRPYLAADRRREDLLTAAAAIVAERGWSALSMLGLAQAAGVSRQLVYQHFASLEDLLIAVTRHLFERTREATEALLGDPATENHADLARRSFQVYFDLPPAQRRILRAITADPDSDAPALRKVRRFVRGEILSLWTPGVRRATGLPEKEARALAWMLVTAAWGASDLVDEREIGLAAARNLLGAVAGAALQPNVRAARSKGALR